MTVRLEFRCDTEAGDSCHNRTGTPLRIEVKNISTVTRTLPVLTKQAVEAGWRFSGRIGWSCPNSAEVAALEERLRISVENSKNKDNA